MSFTFQNTGEKHNGVRQESEPSCVDGVKSLPPSDVFDLDYRRRRWIGETLNAIACGRASAADIRNARDYFETTHARRLQTDKDIFFPLLRDHCSPEDKIEELIGKLDNADGIDGLSSSDAATVIDNATAGRPLVDHDQRLLEFISGQILKRAAITKAALIPIACVRFDDAAMSILVDALRTVDNDLENLIHNHRGTQ